MPWKLEVKDDDPKQKAKCKRQGKVKDGLKVLREAAVEGLRLPADDFGAMFLGLTARNTSGCFSHLPRAQVLHLAKPGWYG